MSQKKNIALLFGGKSVEHAVSIRSASNVFTYIDTELFSPILLYINRNGHWFLVTNTSENLQNGQPITIQLAGETGFYVGKDKLDIDMAFPLLHGTNGEDGSVQGMLNALDIPYVGSGVLGSAVNMSKLTSKKILEQSGLPTARFFHFHKSERDQISFDQMKEELSLPFMVKAANLGSSVGISKVKTASEFEKALDDAFTFDRVILIEEYVEGREIECALIGNFNPKASRPGEIIVSDSYDFYDFNAKYVDGKAVEIEVPANISEEVIEQIQAFCKKAFIALECEDYARVDLFLTQEGRIYLNEINSIPGFTDASMFPMMWMDAGISFTHLITELIDLAFKRQELLNETKTDYISDLDERK